MIYTFSSFVFNITPTIKYLREKITFYEFEDQNWNNYIKNKVVNIHKVKWISKCCFALSESEKMREMAAATESPPKGGFQFNDDQEYPPLNQKSDWGRDRIPEDEWRLRCRLMFCTVVIIHFVVRIGEKLILYWLDIDE